MWAARDSSIRRRGARRRHPRSDGDAVTHIEIDSEVLAVLLHATGANDCTAKPSLKVGWRNRYCAGPSHYRWDACKRAVGLGLLGEEPDAEWVGGDSLFWATPAGLELCSAWVADRVRGRVWDVTVDGGDGTHTIRVIADTRSKAKADVVCELREVWNCTWREAAGAIKRCVKVTP